MRTKQVLSLAEAKQIVAAARVEAEKNGWPVSIAVVDDAGALIALERADGGFAQSAEVAWRKAWTAAAVRAPTKALEDTVKDRPATAFFPGQLRVQGGLPVKANGECVGAVGVSGATSPQDEQVAAAGIAALKLG